MASPRQRQSHAATSSTTPRAITRRGQRINFSVDPQTHARLTWSASTLRALLDVPVNLSTVLRVALGVYVDHVDQLMEQIRQARAQGFVPSVTDFSGTCEASHALIREVYYVRRANQGADALWSELPADTFSDADSLPKYSELEEAERKRLRARPLPDLEEFRRQIDPLVSIRDDLEHDT
jgi:hypothetical protein